jgi:hypothetical protein
MDEGIRFEQMERERDFYREQGAAKERERIYGLVRSYADEDYPRNLDETLEISLAAIANGALASGHDYGARDERNRIVRLLMQEYQKMLDAGHKAHSAGLDYAIKVLNGEH